MHCYIFVYTYILTLNIYFRFNPLYPELFGGIVAVPASTFKAVNGMSNLFYGWGGEDDDFYRRLTHNNIDICRYPSRLSRYTMMKHAHDTPRYHIFKYIIRKT